MNIADEVLAGGARDAIALIAGDQHLTYAALDTLCHQAANLLTGLGVKPGDRVMLQMADSPALVAAYLGAIRCGAVAVCVNTFWRSDELAFAIEDSGARVVIVDSTHEPAARKAIAALTAPPTLVHADAIAAAPITPVSVPRAPDDIALWIYTSGTTGRPKAAMHRHGSLRPPPGYMDELIDIGPSDRVLITSKLFFAFAAAHGVFGALRRGATLILHAPWPDAETIAGLIARTGATILFAVPSLYAQLLQAAESERTTFQSLRACFSAGEKLPSALFSAWRERLGVDIREGIGATETMFLFLVNPAKGAVAGCTGLPAPGTRLKLLDRDGSVQSQPDEIGMLSVVTPTLFAGYWNGGETAAPIEDGWYRTGDLFRFDAEGRWYHEGRADDLVKISGQWLNPREIEDCVQEASAGTDIAVVGAPGENGLERIVLFAAGVDTAQRKPFERMVRERVPSRLGRHKLPKEIRFVDALPRTATGKVQRYLLRTMMAAGG